MASDMSPFSTGKYKTQLFDPRTGGFMQTNEGIGMHVDVRDPEDKPILSAVSISPISQPFGASTR